MSSGFLSVFVAVVLFQYYDLVSDHRPLLAGSHFATLAVLLFVLAWHYRGRLKVSYWVLILSDLTYSIYLFHFWGWLPIKKVLSDFSVTVLHPDVQALLVLFPICFIMMKFVEKPANRLGRIVLTRLHRHGPPTRQNCHLQSRRVAQSLHPPYKTKVLVQRRLLPALTPAHGFFPLASDGPLCYQPRSWSLASGRNWKGGPS